ncbi:MAG: AgmX/PglI C-terminal domain-containing protein [Myxococcales bacterium]|nr:AgmX/PglI C-terminal domain-containing protein [Myxococcales bacterium]
MTSPRALRVGVLLGGSLVEERVFRDGPITIGQSLGCSLSVPAAGVPRTHVLVTRDEGRLVLHVPAGATGTLAHGDTLTELAGTIVLGHGARGKLVLGEATLLFQEIAAPPIAPRPVLPASIRGTLGDRIDRRLAAIVGASVIAHLAIAGYAWWQDLETGSMLETPVAMQYRQEVIEVTLPDDPPATTQDPAPGASVPATPLQTPRPIVKPTRVNVKTGAPEPAMSEDDAQRFASILTGSEVGQTGATEMGRRQPGADLDKQLDAVGDREVVIGNQQKGFRTKDREGIGDGNGPDLDNPTEVSQQKPKDGNEPDGRIQIKPLPPEGPGTTLTVQMVLDKIKGQYMFGLQRCYKTGLVQDSKLSGKISMSFTVTENGKLDDTSARGVSSEVDSCIQNLMSGWRFAIPRDKDGDPTEQPFKLSLALQPS